MAIVTHDDIRHFLMDRGAADNTLLDDVEFSDPDIMKAVEYAVDQWNVTPPHARTKYTPGSFPHKALLVMAAGAWLLRSKAINFERNTLNGTTRSGTTVNDKQKMQTYMSLAKELSAEVRELTKTIKVTDNVNACWGHVEGPFGGF